MNTRNKPSPAQRLQLDKYAERWEALFISLTALRRLDPLTWDDQRKTWDDDLNRHTVAISTIKKEIREITLAAIKVHPDGLTVTYANIKSI